MKNIFRNNEFPKIDNIKFNKFILYDNISLIDL